MTHGIMYIYIHTLEKTCTVMVGPDKPVINGQRLF